MRIRYSGVRDPSAVMKDVERGRNKLAEFVPEIRQMKQREVREINPHEEQRIQDPERERTFGRRGD